MAKKRNQVFISYCHDDREWLERLQVHLKPLQRAGAIVPWDDTRIRAGSDWKAEIERQLDHCAVAVLLVTAEFVASDFINDKEMPPLLARAKDGGTRIMPVIVGTSSFFEIPELARIQAVGDPERPLRTISRNEQDKLFTELARDVLAAIAEQPDDEADGHTGRERAGAQKPAPGPGETYRGPGFALVIGIGTYAHGQSAGETLTPRAFTNLRYARKDAEDVAAYLENDRFIRYDVHLLRDEEATLGDIKAAIDDLAQRCERSGVDDPLAIVYFSGHGASDSRGRHYLVPHEARRDNLFRTALWNKNLHNTLEEVNTRRLVVILDACHSADVGLAGVKGGALSGYDPCDGLQGGPGLHLIASCGPGEVSYEGDGNSIFTAHLLDVLRCEDQGFENEEIDLFDVFRALEKRVDRAARASYGRTQVPISTLTGPTGIVLAMNRHATREKQAFLDAVLAGIDPAMGVPSTPESGAPRDGMVLVLKTTLKRYVSTGQIREQYAGIAKLFDVFLGRWNAGVKDCVPECCELIAFEFDAAGGTQRPIRDTRPAKPAGAVDRFEDAAQPGVGRSPAAPAPTPAPARTRPDQGQEPRSEFSAEDRQYILAGINRQIAYFRESTKLNEILSRPITQQEFAQVVVEIRDRAGSDELNTLLADVVERFAERLPGAKQVTVRSVSSLRLGMGMGHPRG